MEIMMYIGTYIIIAVIISIIGVCVTPSIEVVDEEPIDKIDSNFKSRFRNKLL